MALPLSVRADLTVLYSEPHRHYHNLRHIMECLRELSMLKAHLKSTNSTHLVDFYVLEAALWFHDAVYDPMRQDNEQESAELFCRTHDTGIFGPMSMAGNRGSRVRLLIEHTAHLSKIEEVESADERILINYMNDIDLAILGQNKVRYQEYAQDIRKEYSFVPMKDYLLARNAVLSGFLARPEIYKTRFFAEKYELKSRENLGSEINENIVLLTR